MAGFSTYIYSDPSIDSVDLWLPIMVSLIFFHIWCKWVFWGLVPPTRYWVFAPTYKLKDKSLFPLWPPLLFLRIIWFNFHEICRIKLRKTCVVLSFFSLAWVFAFGRDIVIWFKNLIIVLSIIFCQVVSAVELVDHWKLKTGTCEYGNFDMQNHGGNLSQCHWHSCLCLYICLWTNHEESSHSNLDISWTLLI